MKLYALVRFNGILYIYPYNFNKLPIYKIRIPTRSNKTFFIVFTDIVRNMKLLLPAGMLKTKAKRVQNCRYFTVYRNIHKNY